jgi:hypothetical protein
MMYSGRRPKMSDSLPYSGVEMVERMRYPVVADRAHRRADDRLVEGGEEHARHQAEDDEQDLPVGHLPAGFLELFGAGLRR